VTPAPDRSNRPLILASLLLAAFAINLDTTIVNVALPTLVRELHASTTQLEWIVDAYNLMFAALVLAAGNLGDRDCRRGQGGLTNGRPRRPARALPASEARRPECARRCRVERVGGDAGAELGSGRLGQRLRRKTLGFVGQPSCV
jgi:hypothetical protein